MKDAKTSKKRTEKSSEKITSLMQSDPSITIAQLSSKLGISTRTIERNIEKLQNDGIIRRDGSRKSGKWLILRESK